MRTHYRIRIRFKVFTSIKVRNLKNIKIVDKFLIKKLSLKIDFITTGGENIIAYTKIRNDYGAI